MVDIYRDKRPQFPGDIDWAVLERLNAPHKYKTYFEDLMKVRPSFEVTANYPVSAAGDVATDFHMYTATTRCRLVDVRVTPVVAGTDGSAVTIALKRCQGTEAPSAGDAMLTATVDAKGTADTVIAPSTSATAANLYLEVGDRIGVDFSGTTTAAEGQITVRLQPIPPIPGVLIAGTNADGAGVEALTNGGFRVETAGADGDGVILYGADWPESWHGGTIWNSADSPLFMANIKTGPQAADIDNCIIWAGLKLTNTATTATDADQVFFRYENGVNSGKWQAIASVDGTDTATDTGVTVAYASHYQLLIDVDKDRKPSFYINDLLVWKSTTALTDDIDFMWVQGVEADGAAEAKELDFYPWMVSQRYV